MRRQTRGFGIRWLGTLALMGTAPLLTVTASCDQTSSETTTAARRDSSEDGGVATRGDVPEISDDADAPGRADDSDRVEVASGLTESGADLYARHCAACHGQSGDGQGVAAAYLFPKPRDFRAGRFRLVSTTNRRPSRDDLLAVLKRGMPGSSMPPWNHLSDAALNALVDEVLRLHRIGSRKKYIRMLKVEEGLTDDEIQLSEVQQEIEDYVQQQVTPGQQAVVPPIGPADDQAVARGKQLYVRQACDKCHGDEGRGDGQQQMVDDEGYPTRPRDFTRGIFKGGHDPASVYRRIAYGMPGTPMPSSELTPSQIIDLSHFILSLSDEQMRKDSLQQRRSITARRTGELPVSAADDAWADVQPVRLRTVPLWWRSGAHPDIEVQAMHDGHMLVLRLSWPDDSPDRQAVRTEAFEDAVAVELYRGDKEPFLGMGASDAPVDVWFWDADRQAPQHVEDQYPDTVVDIFPFHEKRVDTAEGDRPGADIGAQPEMSLPAVASGNAIVPGDGQTGSGGSALTAGGPQTVTFRLPQNQAVDAQGQWTDGRWTVVMKRPLAAPSAGDGVSLAPGQRASIALAVWNGSQNDRDGQKRITIWNDLLLQQ